MWNNKIHEAVYTMQTIRCTTCCTFKCFTKCPRPNKPIWTDHQLAFLDMNVLQNVPSLFIPAFTHLLRRQALHWFLCVLSTGHLLGFLDLHTYCLFLLIDLCNYIIPLYCEEENQTILIRLNMITNALVLK